jgi:6-pyruvoyltetrahydropterin/6-carboxytetrahydropterin synthase
MSSTFHIRLAKERHVFSAAHFITYGDDVCEPLHGHNYRVAVEVHGPLGGNAYVVDFIAVRDAVQAIVDRLDHRVLLPTNHPTIRLAELGGADGEVQAVHGSRRWAFPRRDCVLLPVANTTAEMLAAYIAEELRLRLPEPPTRMEVAVDECDGQWGVYRWSADDPAGAGGAAPAKSP